MIGPGQEFHFHKLSIGLFVISAVLLGLVALAAAGLWPRFMGESPGARTDAQAPRSKKADSRVAPIPATDEARESEASLPAAGLPGVEASTATVTLLVPAYFHPSGKSQASWIRLIEASAHVPLVIIVNPSSGPGMEIEKAYAEAIDQAANKKITVIGYINTEYGKRPLEAVKAEIERWARFYPKIRGFFFDAQAKEAEHVNYYREISKYAKARVAGALVATNPGTACAEDFFSRSATDVACVFEHPTGFSAFSLDLWARRYPLNRFAALPYKVVGEDAMKVYVGDAAGKGIGYLYVTDGSGENPWADLPSYWDAEVEAVHRVNQRQVP